MCNNLNHQISYRINVLLKERNITAYQMIKELGIKKSTLYSRLKSKRLWTPYSLYQISNYLDISIDYLVFGPAKKQLPNKPISNYQ